ncbi:MAG: Crp/Fnr family transcriptional regulator [Pseudomonadota bacterium]
MLPQTGFLASASDALTEMLRALARERQLEKGEVLFEQGDKGETLYAILDGALEISVISEDGRKLSLDMLTDGALLGEIALFDPGPRTATVTALKPTRVLGVSNRDVLLELQKRPALAADLMQLAGTRMRWMDTQISEQAFLPLPVRLARKVLYLLGDGPSDRLPLSQANLAEFVGVSREAVSKTLADWKRAGIVEISRGGIRLSNRDALEDLAQPEAF